MGRPRPQPRHKNGFFIPPAPIPRDIKSADFRFRDSLTSVFVAARNPLETFSATQFKIPVSQYSLMGNIFTQVTDPEVIRHIFIENRDNYRMSPLRQRVLKPMLGDGLITAEGETWKHARRTMSPMFTPRNVSTFARTMRATTERELPNLLKTDEIQTIAPIMSALTFLVLSDTLFSRDIDRDQSQMIRDVSIALSHMGRPDPMDIMNAPSWIPRLVGIGGRRAVRRLRRSISEATDKRKTIATKAMPDDFLTRLLTAENDGKPAFSAEQIEDQMISFIGAGHETTARALAWMLYLLSNDPAARERLEAEVDALDMDTIDPVDWDKHLPWAMACFEETMRLYPPAPFISREPIADDQIGLVHIPERTNILVNLWVMHRSELLWEHPSAFNPTRFLGKARDKIDRFQYLPFGMGERVCIGQRFAMQEAAILIALLVRTYRFDYAGSEVPWPKMRVTVQPENNMPMTVTRRHPNKITG